MSKKSKSVTAAQQNKYFFAVSLLAFATFIFLAQYTSTIDIEEERAPASVEPYSLERFHKDTHIHKKITPPISVSIDKSMAKVYANDEFQVDATIVSKTKTKNIKVKWILPKFIEVIEGQQQLEIGSLGVDEKKVVSLRLKSFSEENQLIHISVEAPFGKSILGASDQINTLLEGELRAEKDALLERSQEYRRQKTK